MKSKGEDQRLERFAFSKAYTGRNKPRSDLKSSGRWRSVSLSSTIWSTLSKAAIYCSILSSSQSNAALGGGGGELCQCFLLLYDKGSFGCALLLLITAQ